jgi:hypothetical protein
MKIFLILGTSLLGFYISGCSASIFATHSNFDYIAKFMVDKRMHLKEVKEYFRAERDAAYTYTVESSLDGRSVLKFSDAKRGCLANFYFNEKSQVFNYTYLSAPALCKFPFSPQLM